MENGHVYLPRSIALLVCVLTCACITDPRSLEGYAETTPALAHLEVETHSHNIVYYQPGEFNAWPANGGGQAWVWGNEMVITFSNGEWIEKTSHNTDLTATQGMKARSTDGGETWTVVPYSIGGPGPEQGNINFAHPDLALKVSKGTPSYYVSYDRARNFAGPYGFGDLLDQSPLAGKAFTSRTDYIVNSANELFFFMSSISSVNDLDFTYMAKTSNAGASFSYVSQIDPGDPDRNVMPSTVRINDNALVTCLRRRSGSSNWIECYRSNNNGSSWYSLGSQVDDTGQFNGNPPALVRKPDGTLVCVYGVRRDEGSPTMSAKASTDEGETWSTEYRLRSDYRGKDAFGEVDLGYPRAFVRPDGKIVTIYYWATPERPEEHIAATVFDVHTSSQP